jgi:hypothetical protein
MAAMIRLQRGKVLRVPQAAGKTVTAHAGTLWITEQGNPRDVMLRSGERFRLIQNGLAIVEAFSDASLSLEP